MPTQERFTFWNNKGGTGKTSLAFQVACQFAQQRPTEKILLIDMCPQANLSELLLGGLVGGGAANLNTLYNTNRVRKSIGGYIQSRLISPFSQPIGQNLWDYVVSPYTYNSNIPQNIRLVPGDSLLDIQASSISNLANQFNAAVSDPWIIVMSWIDDLIEKLNGDFSFVFFDTNPSFSVYTQLAIFSTTKIIAPVTPDDSSRRALENVFSLIYGIGIPASVTPGVLFANQYQRTAKPFPLMHLVVKNALTSYMVRPASAYRSILSSIDEIVSSILVKNPTRFSKSSVQDMLCEVRDFHTSGIVSFAHGNPFFNMQSGNYDILGLQVQVARDQLDASNDHIINVVSRL